MATFSTPSGARLPRRTRECERVRECDSGSWKRGNEGRWGARLRVSERVSGGYGGRGEEREEGRVCVGWERCEGAEKGSSARGASVGRRRGKEKAWDWGGKVKMRGRKNLRVHVQESAVEEGDWGLRRTHGSDDKYPRVR
eukprot:2956058-Pleurochrysis_carterae.AAC.2